MLMSEDEKWIKVEEKGKLNTRGEYYISDKGNFYSTFTKKLIKAQKCHKGYLYVEIGRKKYKVHRLVAKYFIPNPNNLPQIDHIDCNKENNCVENLRWVSNRENYEHALEAGTFSKEFLKYVGNPKLMQKRHKEKLQK